MTRKRGFTPLRLCGRRPSILFFSVLTLVIVACAGCASESEPKSESAVPSKKPTVFVVNYPLAYFAQRVGGESVDVAFPVPDEFDPAHWDPDAEAIAAFQSADLVLLNGADYAKWTLRATLPWSRTVVTTRDVEDQYIEVPDAVTHSHGPEGEHAHAALASETWLDPQLAIEQARVIKEELEKLVPASADSIKANFDALVADLQSLDEEFKSTFAQIVRPVDGVAPGLQLCRASLLPRTANRALGTERVSVRRPMAQVRRTGRFPSRILDALGRRSDPRDG